MDKYAIKTDNWEYMWMVSAVVAVMSAWAMCYNYRRVLYFAIIGK